MVALLALLGSAPASGLEPPAVRSCPQVAWPVEAPGERAVVQLEITVLRSGRVSHVGVQSGAEPFRSLAQDAAAACLFDPAVEDGEPVASQVPFTWTVRRPPVRVRGVLLESGTGQPVAGTLVRAGRSTAITDASGRFELRDLPDGPTQVVVVSADWHVAPQPVQLDPNEGVALELWGRSGDWSREAVGRYRRNPPAGRHHSYSVEEAAALPGTLGDPVRAVQNLPSVVRTPLDAGWVLLRGGGPTDTGLFVDGVAVPMLFHLGGTTSIVQPSSVAAVDVHPGAPPASLGRSRSGSVNLRLAELPEDHTLEMGLNAAWARAFVSTPLPRGRTLAVGARRSWLHAAAGLVSEGAEAAIPTFADGEAHLTGSRGRVDWIGMTDRGNVPTGRNLDTVELHQTAHLLMARYDGTSGGAPTLQAWGAWQQQSVLSPTRDQALTEPRVGARATWFGGDELRWAGGLELESSVYTAAWNGPAKSARRSLIAPWAEARWGDRVEQHLGIRLDQRTTSGQRPRISPSPRGDVRVPLTPELAWVGEAGRLSSAPHPLFEVGYPEGAWLPLDQLAVASTGLQWRDGVAWAASADVWGRSGEQAGIELDGTLSSREVRAGGVEAVVDWTGSTSRVRVVGQVQRSQSRDDTGQAWSLSRYDQSWRMLVLARRELPHAWLVSTRVRAGSGYPAFDIAPIDTFDLFQQSVRPADVTRGRLAAPYAIDLKVSKRWTQRRMTVEAWIDVQNLTNRRTPDPVINGIDNDVVVYAWSLPMLPLFGVDLTARAQRLRAAPVSESTSWQSP